MMLDVLRLLFIPEPRMLIYACKTVLSALLAFAIALYLQLTDPRWAMLTAVIVAQPTVGMALQKGFARLGGTFCGSVLAITIMAFGLEKPWFFVYIMCAWLFLCATAGSVIKSAWSYAFALAGYTVLIICMPNLNNPINITQEGVFRCVEISLGIICSMLCHSLILPTRSRDAAPGQAKQAWVATRQACLGLISNAPEASERSMSALNLIYALVTACEPIQFEGTKGKARSLNIRIFTHECATALRLARMAGQEITHLPESTRSALLSTLQTALDQSDVEQLSTLREHLLKHSVNSPEGSPGQQESKILASLIDQILVTQSAFSNVSTYIRPRFAPPIMQIRPDVTTAIFFGLRCALAIFGVFAYWIATAWSSGTSTIMMLGLATALMASNPNADKVMRGFSFGALWTLPIGLILLEWVLPYSSGTAFGFLGIAYAVPLIAGILLSSKWPVSWGAFGPHLVALTAPKDDMSYDAASFTNSVLSTTAAYVFAGAVFYLFKMQYPRGRCRRRVEDSLTAVKMLTRRRSLYIAEGRFTHVMSDYLNQLGADCHGKPKLYPAWQASLTCLDLGNQIIALRHALQTTKTARLPLNRFFRRLRAQLFRVPKAGQADKLDAPAQEFLAQLAPQVDAKVLADCRHAVEMLLKVWRKWCLDSGQPPQQPALPLVSQPQ